MTPSDMALDFAARREQEKWGEAKEHAELMRLIERAQAEKRWAISNIDNANWEVASDDASKLTHTLIINGAFIHLEAYQVTKSEDGQLKLVLGEDSGLFVDLDKIHDALGADGEFSTMEHNGKHYVVLGFPYED